MTESDRVVLGVLFYGVYGVMVSTEVCGTSSSGSNPDRHPNVEEEVT